MRRQSTAAFEAEHGVFPIQVRPDLVVRVSNVPHDLTKAEAERIARIIMAMAS